MQFRISKRIVVGTAFSTPVLVAVTPLAAHAFGWDEVVWWFIGQWISRGFF